MAEPKEDFDLQYSTIIEIFSISIVIKNFPKIHSIKYREIDDIINEVEQYKKSTGIMIGNFCINQNYSVFFFIFDDQIIITDHSYLLRFKNFFDNNRDKTTFFFLNSQCETIFQEIISGQFEIEKNSSENNFEQEKSKISSEIKKQISNCIIKKSQIKTLNRRQKSKFGLNLSEKNIEFKYKNFIKIKQIFGPVSLYLNYIDQFLYILKEFDMFNQGSQNQFDHEIQFYERIENKHPYISKYFGQLENHEKKIIIIEYIEGTTLMKFIKNKKNQISIGLKQLIIYNIISAIEYIHSKNIILRDLKDDNIMIDSNGHAILIDFDKSKYLGLNKEIDFDEEVTGDIGCPFFISPEQYSKNQYSKKGDIYSLGMIIHLIITETPYSFNLLDKINEKKENILNLKEIPRCKHEYEELKEIYKKCLEYLPESRPDTITIFESLFKYILEFYVLNKNNENNLYFKEVIQSFELLGNKNCTKIQFIFGTMYYIGEYISRDVNKAMHFLTQSANQNNPKAQHFIGNAYLHGEFIPKNINKAIYYITQSAHQNYSSAQYLLGKIYYEGKYISRDVDKALYYLTQSVNQNNSDAQFYLGLIYYEGKFISIDINKAMHYFTLSANQNNSDALFYLGIFYYSDDYISRDIKKAIYYFTLSSNLGNSSAQNLLGNIYYDGKYVKRDIAKSIHYYELSSNLNNNFSQFLLGHLFYEGKYVSRDLNKAIHYLTLSANQNNHEAIELLTAIECFNQNSFDDLDEYFHCLFLLAGYNDPDAQCTLGYLFYEGDIISRNITKAIHYLTLSSDQNNSDAQFLLGMINYTGKYVVQDINKSIHYLYIASKQNNPNAQYLLGLIYYKGEYIQHNINKAIYYLTLSANQNHPESQYLLGFIYYSNQYIEQDINKAIYYLKSSANLNDPEAQYLLGVIYYCGQDVEIKNDINKTIFYLTLSANQNNSDAQFLLSKLYYDGIFVSQDINKSIHYLTLSAEDNNSDAQYTLGEIYYSGEFVLKDINKAIHYFKEASCFYNSKAKNNLGVIYKNGDGVIKNIFFAIEYFEEAIRQKYDMYSLYNLSRIYYFGIDIEKNIGKSIELIKMASKELFLPAKIFLDFIEYQLSLDKHDDSLFNINFLENMEYYEVIQFIQNDLNIKMQIPQRLLDFFKLYDLEYASNKNFDFDFCYYLMKGCFPDRNHDYNVNNSQKKSLKKNIDKHFYEGFGFDILENFNKYSI